MSDRIFRMPLPAQRWFDDKRPLLSRPRFMVTVGGDEGGAAPRRLRAAELPRPKRVGKGNDLVVCCMVGGAPFELVMMNGQPTAMVDGTGGFTSAIDAAEVARRALGLLVFDYRARSGNPEAAVMCALIELALPYAVRASLGSTGDQLAAADAVFADVFSAVKRTKEEGYG